jgi:hypothetical protein
VAVALKQLQERLLVWEKLLQEYQSPLELVQQAPEVRPQLGYY